MNVCVIPARGGSKRIPRKNILPFAGKPMLERSMETALQVSMFDKVVVSSDSPEVLEMATNHPGVVPLMRPEELSGDNVATRPVVAHAIDYLSCEHGLEIDNVCCLYATAAFTTPEDLKSAFQILVKNSFEYICPITEFFYPIQRAFRMSSESRLQMLNTEYAETPSQNLEKSYHDAGQFYWGSAKAWSSPTAIFCSEVGGYLMPKPIIDIDYPSDWQIAEIFFNAFYAS